jgi:dolichol-phosphate mannosyltransferase
VNAPHVVQANASLAHSSLHSNELSVVVPTYNEQANILPLLAGLARTLEGVGWEVLFVDDNSPDGTTERIRDVALSDPRVRILTRIGRRGLSSACIEGILATSTPYVAVMDADLQHDESALMSMFERIKSEDLDIVIGSRIMPGGSMGEISRKRALLSAAGSRISRLVCHCDISDPMSGFFVMRREFWREVVHRLTGKGFKLLLDVLASSSRRVRLAEVPYRFRQRQWGKSKLDLRVELAYVYLVADKLVETKLSKRSVAD